MNIRTLPRRWGLIALMVALVFSPMIATADELPQSDEQPPSTVEEVEEATIDPDEDFASTSGKEESDVPSEEELDPLGPTGPSTDLDEAGSQGEGEATEEASYDSLLDLIIGLVEENPSITIGQIIESLGLPAEGPLSLIHVDGMLSVTITFAEAPTSADADRVGQHAQVRRILDVAPVIMGYAYPTALAGLRDTQGVTSVEVNLQPDTGVVDKELTEEEKTKVREALREADGEEETAAASNFKKGCRTIPPVANGPLKVDKAWSESKMTGKGVKVGIISDSYDEDKWAITTAAQDVKAGLLPGPGNPCGYTQAVKVINRGTGVPSMRDDEGRAMAQIVHGIAPGAALVVGTMGQSEEDMAQNVKDLVAQGVDIIVDDINWASETLYQKGILSAEVDKAKAKGITYLASAGNSNSVMYSGGKQYPVASHQSKQFVGAKCHDWVRPPQGLKKGQFDCLDFSPNKQYYPFELVQVDPYDSAGNSYAGDMTQLLNWAEPINGVKTKLHLQMYKVTNGSKVAYASDPMPLGNNIPAQLAFWDERVSPYLGPNDTVAFVVVRDRSKSGWGSPMLRVSAFGGSDIAARQYYRTTGNNVIQSSQVGHDGDGSAAAVAAAAFYEPTTVEEYSSLGGNQQWYPTVQGKQVAKPLATKVTPKSPQFMGIDAIATSFFGEQYPDPALGGTVYLFYGTSASAPTAAGVAALGLQKNPSMSHNTVVKLLRETANKSVPNPYSGAGINNEWTVGAGLIDAQAFLKKVPKPGGTKPGTVTISRVYGPNRYVTNQGVNTKFAVKNGPVFIATGANFADALSIGPVVGMMKGTLFLTPRKSMGYYGLNMIKQISPSAVYIIGGTGAVSANVAAEVKKASGKTPIRVSGKNRYETSEKILKRFFVDTKRPIKTAFVATGRDFPDALSAASAGSALKAPVLLVNGKTGRELSPYMLNSLRSAKTSKVLIAGGTGAVNSTIEANTKKHFSVQRLAGPNRYATNAAINAYLGTQAGSTPMRNVFIATGRGFPDALSFAAPAGNLSSRLVLSNGKCVPKPVVSAWILNPKTAVDNVYLAGGPSVLSKDVFNLVQCK